MTRSNISNKKQKFRVYYDYLTNTWCIKGYRGGYETIRKSTRDNAIKEAKRLSNKFNRDFVVEEVTDNGFDSDFEDLLFGK